MDICSCGKFINEDNRLLNDDVENEQCSVCYKKLCKKCAVDIVTEYVCKECDDAGAW